MAKSTISLVALTFMVIMHSCKEQTTETRHTPLVRTITVAAHNPNESQCYPGIIKPEKEISISFKVNGQIKYILDKPGEEVRKGDLIASLDPLDYEINLEAATASYKQSNSEFERIQQLNNSKTISPNDFEKAAASHKITYSKYQAARNAVEYTKIQAPFDGYVQSIYHQKGENVQASMPVISFISKKNMKVEVFLPFRDYKRIRELSESYLIVDGKHIELKLSSISQQANAAQLYKAEFHIPANGTLDRNIAAGKNCQVRLIFLTAEKENTACIPLSAIMNNNNETAVWVLGNQNIVTKVRIKIRNIDHNQATVLGIKEGQQVITSGVHSVNEGDTVTVMPAQSKTNIGGML